MELDDILFLLEYNTYSGDGFAFLAHNASTQTTMTAISTVVVSHTALILNEIFQNSLSSMLPHRVGYKSYTPVKVQGGYKRVILQCTHTSQRLSYMFIYVLLCRNFAAVIKVPNQLTLLRDISSWVGLI